MVPEAVASEEGLELRRRQAPPLHGRRESLVRVRVRLRLRATVRVRVRVSRVSRVRVSRG